MKLLETFKRKNGDKENYTIQSLCGLKIVAVRAVTKYLAFYNNRWNAWNFYKHKKEGGSKNSRIHLCAFKIVAVKAELPNT